MSDSKSNKKNPFSGSFIIGYDFETPGKGVLIVGQKILSEEAHIINAFENEEAWDIYTKLKTRKEKNDE